MMNVGGNFMSWFSLIQLLCKPDFVRLGNMGVSWHDGEVTLRNVGCSELQDCITCKREGPIKNSAGGLCYTSVIFYSPYCHMPVVSLLFALDVKLCIC
jgi:hypothetical protein